MTVHIAPALDQLRGELTHRWPGRSLPDGWIGDAAHQARESDHNPDANGSVNALDIKRLGIDVAELLAALFHDHRTAYVIHARRIYRRANGFRAEPYAGSNPHLIHVHLSIRHGDALEDDRSSWGIGSSSSPAHPVTSPKPATPTRTAPRFPLEAGSYFGPRSGPRESVSGYLSHRADLLTWQRRMVARGWRFTPPTPDGLYGSSTAGVARAFQRDKHLVVDGRIGPATWRAAWDTPVT